MYCDYPGVRRLTGITNEALAASFERTVSKQRQNLTPPLNTMMD
jgi:hypothetical protein